MRALTMWIELLAAVHHHVSKQAADAAAAEPWTLGWLIVLLYLAGGALCLWTGRREQQAQLRAYEVRVPWFWLFLGGLLILLGLAKMLGVQEWVDDIGRGVAREEGVYQDRRQFQNLVIGLVGGIGGMVGLVAVAALVWLVRRVWQRYVVPLVGAVYLVVFVLIRAVSLHQVDHALADNSMCGVTLNAWLEILGIVLVVVPALKAFYDDRRPGLRAYESKVWIR
jgi:hypothetical protein